VVEDQRLTSTSAMLISVLRPRLLALLERDGDLVDIDASEVDLSSDVIEREARPADKPAQTPPCWFSEVTGGINFADRRLNRVQFNHGKAWRGDFARSTLDSTSFRFCDAGLCRFTEAKLSEADFTGATLSRATFENASLRRTNFCDADLRDTNFVGATFEHVYFAGAVISNARIERRAVAGAVAEPLDGDYLAAVTAYSALKVNFRSLGQFDDASWAYLQERRMETKSLAPWRRDVAPIRRALLCLRWLGSCLSGLIAGYGERPLRAAAFIPAIIAIFGLFYWRLGDLTVDGIHPASLGACLRESLASFVTLGTSGSHEVRPRSAGAQIWTSLEAMGGVSLIALIMFSLGKRITRS